MGRHSKNKGNWGIIDGTNKKLAMYSVDLPYPFIVHVRPEYTNDAVDCAINHTQSIIVNDLFSEKDDVMEFMKAYGDYPVYAEPMKMRLTDLCPKCEESGIPKISLRNRNSYQLEKTGRYDIPTTNTHNQERNQIIKEKEPEYWLLYWHGKGDQHWIQEYQGSIEGTFKTNKKKAIDPRNFLLGQVMRIKTAK